MNLRVAEFRLSRPVPGRRQLMAYGTVLEADRRLEREGLVKDRVGAVRRPLSSGETRPAQGQPRCEPNAPQLIRLVRTPFSVEPTFNQRHPQRDRLGQRESRRPYHQVIAEALARPALVGLPGIHRERPSVPPRRLWTLREDG